jgi:hypothetical protein
MKPISASPLYTSENPAYHLVSCAGDSILRLFPGRRDETEEGADWLTRILTRLSDQIEDNNPLQDAIRVGLREVEPERLWVLLNAPENMPRSQFLAEASNLLVRELGLAPTPALAPGQAPAPVVRRAPTFQPTGP